MRFNVRSNRVTLLIGWLAVGGLAFALLPEGTLGQSPSNTPSEPPAVSEAPATFNVEVRDVAVPVPVTVAPASSGVGAPAPSAAPLPGLVPAPPAAPAPPVTGALLLEAVPNAQPPAFSARLAPPPPGTATPLALPVQPGRSPQTVYAYVDQGQGRDQQLRSIEARIEGLLAELRSLQTGQPVSAPAQLAPSASQPAPAPITARLPGPVRRRFVAQAPTQQPNFVELPGNEARAVAVPTPVYTVQAAPPANAQMIVAAPRSEVRYTVVQGSEGVEQTTLIRAKYTLPAAKAESLAAFIAQHLPDVDAKSAGDSLTVTATPDAQGAIGQFVALLKRAAPAPADPNAAATEPKAVPLVPQPVPESGTTSAEPAATVPALPAPEANVPK